MQDLALEPRSLEAGVLGARPYVGLAHDPRFVEVDKDKVAGVISNKVAPALGATPDSVTCPDNLKGVEGATLRCTVNSAGKTVAPSLDSFAAAASNADWVNAKNFNLIITNQPGDESWPIAASTWIIVYSKPDDPAATGEALKFFDWAYKNGKEAAAALDYVAIPDNVVAVIEKSWETIVDADGKPVFTAQ